VDFGIEAFWWRIAVKTTLRDVNKMLGKCWLPHQPSHAVDDVSTPVFDRALVTLIPFYILESQIISHVSHDLLYAIPVVDAWETLSCVFLLRHFVIVRIHALLRDLTLDIFVLFTRCKRIPGIVL
jgi:hypothetical protein